MFECQNSDLAIEKCGNFEAKYGQEYGEEELGYCTICRLNISSDELSNKYGKPKGMYVTVFCDRISRLDRMSFSMLAETLANELCVILDKACGAKNENERSFLVAGLGNSQITADAIGPLAVEKITVTRHLHHESSATVCNVSAIAPSVLSKTGIETVELVRKAAEEVVPDAVIAIDALAAKSCERLGATVQISDNGIIPGTGIGNVRKAINKKNVGVPVIAIGVPTVVDSATLVLDALERAGVDKISDKLFSVLREGKSFFVTPKESDEITASASSLIATALNIAFGIYS